MEHLGQVGGLKREEGMQYAITELKSLLRGEKVDINSACSSKIPVSLPGRIANAFLYGKERNPTLIFGNRADKESAK